MKVAGKRPAAAVGVSLAVVGALRGKTKPNSASQHAAAAGGDDAAAVAALEEKKKPGMIPTKVRHDKKPVRRHGNAIPELRPMASK